MELRIFNQDDRIKVAAILVKNGYEVAQKKRKKTETGKTYVYYLEVEEVSEDVRVESK